MQELKAITRASAALAVSATSLAVGSVLTHVGWVVLLTGIATRRTGRDVVEVLQR
jgi:hypothetical protein